MSLTDWDGARLALAINLELSHGRHGAAVRFELLERDGPRLARVELSGWVDAVAIARLERAVVDLARHGVDGVILDCSRVRHIDHKSLPRLARVLEPFMGRPAGARVAGLLPHLRERFPFPNLDGAQEAPASDGPEAS